MQALDRKLLRDLANMKSQSIAIALVIACGVATFVMSLCTLRSLQASQSSYYARSQFAQIFAHLKKAPNSLSQRLAQIPGVAAVQTRVVVDVNLDVPGLSQPAVARLISIPDHQQSTLNQLYLRSGRYVEPANPDEVLVNEAFANANNFTLGSTLRAVINGHQQTLRIVGIVLSPEYVLQVREGDAWPDLKRFGVFWMAQSQLAPAYDMDGAFNDLALTTTPNASEPEVLRQIDQIINPYGGVGSYGREDQLSNHFLSNEINSLKGIGIISPSLFLAVAVFLLNVVMSRLINVQREQIAAIKAFGRTNFEIALHYLKFAVVISLAGVLIGMIFGAILGKFLTGMYATLYHFPQFQFDFSWTTACLALAIGILAAIAGALASARRAVRLPPAEAMRPEPPASYKPTLVERIGLQKLLNQPARIVLRNLERRPWRAFVSILGIALAVAILISGNFINDDMDWLMQYSFFANSRQDMTVHFNEVANSSAEQEIQHLPGVLKTEPFRSVPARVTHGQHSRRMAVMGVNAHTELYRLVDEQMRPVDLPPTGLVLSSKLAQILDVQVGDLVHVEVLDGDRPIGDLRVSSLLNDFSGLNAYVEINALHRFMHEGPVISGVFLDADANQLDPLYAQLKSTPRVVGVSVKNAMLQGFRETIQDNQKPILFFNAIFAAIIATGIVYNTARISLSERSRELATLRVIGFTQNEISRILLGELATLTLLAIPLGMLIGYAFTALIVTAYSTELFRLPIIIAPSTWGLGAAVTIAAAAASAFAVHRKLNKLDLVSVLKSKE